MGIQLSSDILLANALYYNKSNEGITFTDLDNLRLKIKENLIKMGFSKTDYIYFGLNLNELNLDISRYSDIFKKFQNKYYLIKPLNINQFNSRLSVEVREAVEKAAQEV